MSKCNQQINLRNNASFSSFGVYWRAQICEGTSIPDRRALPASLGGCLSSAAPWQWAQRGLDTARIAKPLRVRSSQVPVGYGRLCGSLPALCSQGSHENLFLIHPCVQPAGKGVITRLWMACWRWLPYMPQESQMNAWYSGHTGSSDIII